MDWLWLEKTFTALMIFIPSFPGSLVIFFLHFLGYHNLLFTLVSNYDFYSCEIKQKPTMALVSSSAVHLFQISESRGRHRKLTVPVFMLLAEPDAQAMLVLLVWSKKEAGVLGNVLKDQWHWAFTQLLPSQGEVAGWENLYRHWPILPWGWIGLGKVKLLSLFSTQLFMYSYDYYAFLNEL